VWTVAEAQQFLDHVRGGRLFALWRLLVVTGLRRGELCGLKWIDLDVVQGSLRICRQRVVEEPSGRVREKRPKSPNSVRTIVLDVQTLRTLEAERATACSPYMFTGRTGLPLQPDNLTDRFNKLAVAAGVRPLGPHQIRHLLVGSLLDRGFSLHEIAERLGHAAATLLRSYARVHAQRRADLADTPAALIADVAPGEWSQIPAQRAAGSLANFAYRELRVSAVQTQPSASSALGACTVEGRARPYGPPSGRIRDTVRVSEQASQGTKRQNECRRLGTSWGPHASPAAARPARECTSRTHESVRDVQKRVTTSPSWGSRGRRFESGQPDFIEMPVQLAFCIYSI